MDSLIATLVGPDSGKLVAGSTTAGIVFWLLRFLLQRQERDAISTRIRIDAAAAEMYQRWEREEHRSTRWEQEHSAVYYHALGAGVSMDGFASPKQITAELDNYENHK